MHGINESLEFKPVRIAVLVVSDTRTLDTDTSGATLVQRLESAGHILADRKILPDDKAAIRAQVSAWIADPEVITPLFDKTIEGFSVIFHQVSFQSVGLSTLQSRAVAGLASGTFIFCLPGSTGAVKDGWDKVISFQLDSRHKPCNLVELMPRLMEHEV